MGQERSSGFSGSGLPGRRDCIGLVCLGSFACLGALVDIGLNPHRVSGLRLGGCWICEQESAKVEALNSSASEGPKPGLSGSEPGAFLARETAPNPLLFQGCVVYTFSEYPGTVQFPAQRCALRA